jgi:glycosyltransferase involved in cell wall biosynthesis
VTRLGRNDPATVDVQRRRHEGDLPMNHSRSRLKIITIGFNISGTGLTRVMHGIMPRLADRHEIHYLGIGYSGETIRDRGLTIYPTNLKGGDVFAAFQAKKLIEEIDPALVFILHDIWCFPHYLKILGPYRDRLKIVGYIPLDGKIVNEEDAASLERADRVVVYTEFARKEFEGAFDRLRQKRGGEFPSVDVIPHGVDLNRFHPLPQLQQASFASRARAEAKRKVFAGLQDPENSFIVLNASRPDKRKRVDLTIAGFARFAAGKPPNICLCLHHAIMGDQEDQIRSLVERFDLKERVVLNPLAGGVVGDRELNLLYNACDVGINTSMGEGWGLVSFEHGAAGAAQIVPAHSACAEIWTGRAEMMQPARSYIPEFSVLEMGEVSAAGVAQALNNLYDNPQRRRQLAQAAYDAAQNPEYAWDSIAERFDELFAELAG